MDMVSRIHGHNYTISRTITEGTVDTCIQLLDLHKAVGADSQIPGVHAVIGGSLTLLVANISNGPSYIKIIIMESRLLW